MDAVKRRVEILDAAEILSPEQRRLIKKAARLEAALTGRGAYDLARYDAALEDQWWAARRRANTESRRFRAATAGTGALDIGQDMEALAGGEADSAQGADGAMVPTLRLVPTDLDCTTVLEAAQGKDEVVTFVEHQRGLCKGCRDPLPKKGLIGTPTYVARFCHYTGFYYCHACCNGRRVLVPALCLQQWDFEERTVCDEMADQLELQAEKPNLCVSALNPRLLQQCPLLLTCRQLRTQLCMLTAIGAHCGAFASQFFAPPQQFQQRSLHDEREAGAAGAVHVPNDKHHLVLDSECWSLKELAEIHSYSPFLGSAAHAPSAAAVPLSAHEGGCPLYQTLRRWRAQMIRHVAQSCQGCYSRAARSCPSCIKDDVVLPFDVENVVVCSRCDTAFHRRCWERLDNGCTTCAAKARRAAAHAR